MYKIFFLFFFIFTYKISKSNGVLINGLEDNDYACYRNIVLKFNLIAAYPDVNGQYNFCQTNSCASGALRSLTLTGVGEEITPSQYLTISDLSCFPTLTMVYINWFPISSEVLYNKWPTVLSIEYNNVMGITGGITQPIAAYAYFKLVSIDLTGTTVKMSYANNVEQFIVSAGNGNFIHVETDSGAVKTKLRTLDLKYVMELPDLSGYTKLTNINIDFAQGYDTASLLNFNNYATPEYGLVGFSWASISVTSSPRIPFTVFGDNMNVYDLMLNYPNFQQPPSIVDISSTTNYNSLTMFIGNYQDVFNYQGALPIKANAKTAVKAYGGLFTTLPSSFEGFKTLSVMNSKVATALPVNSGNATRYDFSGNQITGTVDPSYCTSLLNVANNKLSGVIPSCFSCYMTGSQAIGSMDANFAGNQFSTVISGPACPTLAPQVRVIDKWRLSITGADIGFSTSNLKINDASVCELPYSKFTGNELLCFMNSGIFETSKYVTVTWVPLNNRMITFPLVSSPPFTSGARVNTVSNTITITGLYFSSYPGYSNQSVEINGESCTISSTSFGQVICTPTNTQVTNELKLVRVSNSNETKAVYIQQVNGAVNNLVCPNDCNGNERGICDLSSGNCVCNTPYSGIDCSLIQCSVPDCNNHGNCNTTIGQCDCFTGYFGQTCEIISCPSSNTNECSGNGLCNSVTGQCNCNENYQSSDCSIPYLSCPSKNQLECSGFGSCNVTGECSCLTNHTLSDCSGIPCAPVDCNGNGICNEIIGKCECTQNKWSGLDCLIPYHYVTSIEPSSTLGGETTFYGLFHDIHIDLSVSIGGKNCPVTFNSSTEIKCIAPPGTGIKLLNITQNDIIYQSKDKYRYQDTNQPCPNNCNNHGTCNTTYGQCICTGYGGFDCSTLPTTDDSNPIIIPPTNSTINSTNGGISLTNQETIFEISIGQLVEVDFNDVPIKSYQLQNRWIVDTQDTAGLTTHTLSQSIQNSNCKIISTIEEIKDTNGKQYTFANIDFKVDQGSIKFSISITNYTYVNNLNTLKLELISSSNEIENSVNSNNECNSKDTEIDTSNYNDNTGKSNNLNYIKISRNNKILHGRFINRVEADGKSTFLSSTTKSDQNQIVTTLNLPHFVKKVVIDPDFSVLMSTEFKSECGDSDDDKRKSYVIPVAVIVSVVGVAAIVTTVLLIKKRKAAILLNKKLLNTLNKAK